MEPVDKKNNHLQRHSNIAKRIVFGLVLIIIGIVFLLKNSGVISEDVADIIISWEMLLIAIGFIGLFGQGKVANLILILIGGYFLVLNHFNVPETFSQIFWPALLILVGIFVVFRAGFFSSRYHMSRGEVNADFINEVAIFGGNNRQITSDSFKGGKVTSVFGGSKIDLSFCKLSEGTNVLEVTSVFGGTNLKVPADWNIKMQVTSIFGGFEDKRSLSATDSSKMLIIKGVAIFGGGEVRNS